MEKIKVFGHKSPDTDATMSAIVWAWFLNEHRKQDAEAFILGEPNTEALFVLKKWNIQKPSILDSVKHSDKVVIVDTNNVDELFENINDTEIISIIDHHRLTGGLKTSAPLEVVIQPYASTMTVMYNIMNIEPKDFPSEIAGLMLSGILSDTLEFRSPTTTKEDERLARSLAEALGINISSYAKEMFDAKSDVSSFSEKELVRMDSKITEIQGESIRISVLETTNPQTILERKNLLFEAIDEVCQEDHLHHVMLFIVDILNEEAILLTKNEHVKEIVSKAFSVQPNEDMFILPGIVSRKKQIIPMLSKN
jgi:manganese-dependent inorganic pyrophosphatase